MINKPRYYLFLFMMFLSFGCTKNYEFSSFLDDEKNSKIEEILRTNCQIQLFKILSDQKKLKDKNYASYYSFDNTKNSVMNRFDQMTELKKIDSSVLDFFERSFPEYTETCMGYSSLYTEQCLKNKIEISKCIDIGLTQFTKAFYFWKTKEISLKGSVNISHLSIPELEEPVNKFTSAFVTKKQKDPAHYVWKWLVGVFEKKSFSEIINNEMVKNEVERKIELLLYLSPLFIEEDRKQLVQLLMDIREKKTDEFISPNLNLFKFNQPQKIKSIKGISFGKVEGTKIPQKLVNSLKMKKNKENCSFTLSGIGISCPIPKKYNEGKKDKKNESVTISLSRKNERVYAITINIFNLKKTLALAYISKLKKRYGNLTGFSPIPMGGTVSAGTFKSHPDKFGNFYWETLTANIPHEKIEVLFSYRENSSFIRITHLNMKEIAKNEMLDLMKENKTLFKLKPEEKKVKNINGEDRDILNIID